MTTWNWNEIFLRNGHFRTMDWKAVFKSQSWTRISDQFSRIILARNGSRLPVFFSISFSLKSLSSIIVKVLDLGEIQWFRGLTIRDFKGNWLLMGRVSCQELKVNLLPQFEQHLCSSKFVFYLRLLTDIELKTKWLNRCSSHRWFFESI